MQRKYNAELIPNAKALRKNMTKEERHLWYDFLKNYPAKVRRQHVLGKYIADFYCPDAKLVIELDGSQHYEIDGEAKDEERTAYISQYGIEVIRIANSDVNSNFDGVCEYINKEIQNRLTASPQSLRDSSPY